MNQQRRVVHFSGNVQGVGFRFTTTRTAEGFDVTGYVKNLPDGNVECVVEGDSSEIDAFLQAVEDRMGHYIRGRKEHTAEYTGQYRSFGVAY